MTLIFVISHGPCCFSQSGYGKDRASHVEVLEVKRAAPHNSCRGSEETLRLGVVAQRKTLRTRFLQTPCRPFSGGPGLGGMGGGGHSTSRGGRLAPGGRGAIYL